MTTPEIIEQFFSTPRTYGNPTGRDHVLSHMPSYRARLAEQVLYCLLQGGDGVCVATRACDIAEEFFAEIFKRGWMLEVEPAPELDPNYGKPKEAKK